MTKFIVGFLFYAWFPQVNANAQDSTRYEKEAIQFLKEMTDRDSIPGIVLLLDKPFILSKYEFIKYFYADTMTFSKSEMDSVLNIQPISKWTNSWIRKYKIISDDTVNLIFGDNSKDWPYFYQHVGSSFRTMSAPLFMRAYQYCLFYSSYQCGRLCGQGHFSLYEKKNGHWIRIKMYCAWIS